jgi:hypothetical protein
MDPQTPRSARSAVRSRARRPSTQIPTVISPDLSRSHSGAPRRLRAVDLGEALDLYVACRAVGGDAELA